MEKTKIEVIPEIGYFDNGVDLSPSMPSCLFDQYLYFSGRPENLRVIASWFPLNQKAIARLTFT